MNDFNLDDFSMGEELRRIINGQEEIAKDAIEESVNSNSFGDDTVNTEQIGQMFEDPFAEFTSYINEQEQVETTKSEDLFGEYNFGSTVGEVKSEDLFGEYNFGSKVEEPRMESSFEGNNFGSSVGKAK